MKQVKYFMSIVFAFVFRCQVSKNKTTKIYSLKSKLKISLNFLFSFTFASEVCFKTTDKYCKYFKCCKLKKVTFVSSKLIVYLLNN